MTIFSAAGGVCIYRLWYVIQTFWKFRSVKRSVFWDFGLYFQILVMQFFFLAIFTIYLYWPNIPQIFQKTKFQPWWMSLLGELMIVWSFSGHVLFIVQIDWAMKTEWDLYIMIDVVCPSQAQANICHSAGFILSVRLLIHTDLVFGLVASEKLGLLHFCHLHCPGQYLIQRNLCCDWF